MKQAVIFAMLFFSFATGFSQEKITLLLDIYPRDAKFIIDGKNYHPLEVNFDLGVGKHNIRIWKPNYSLMDTTIFLEAKKNNTAKFVLQPSKEFLEYSEFRKSKKKLRVTYTLSTSVLLGTALYSFFRHKIELQTIENSEKSVRGYADRYSNAFTGFDNIRGGFDRNYADYTKAIKNHNLFKVTFIGSAIGLGLNTALFYVFGTFEKYKKPKREAIPKGFENKFKVYSTIDNRNNLLIGFNYDIQ